MSEATRRLDALSCLLCGAAFLGRKGAAFCGRVCAATNASRIAHAVPQSTTPESSLADRVRAHGLVNMRVRRGAMARPDACGRCCKVGKVDAHHADYSKPAEVSWLCRSCHMLAHRTAQQGQTLRLLAERLGGGA